MSIPTPDRRQPVSLLLAVVIVLGGALLLSLGLAGWLAATDHDVPEFLVATGSGALGALAAILVPRAQS